MVRSRVLGIFGVIALSAVACAAPTDEESGESSDAVSLDTYWADAKALKTDDLMGAARRAGVGLAADKINDALSTPNVGAAFTAPAVFAAKAQPNSLIPDSAEIKGLDTLVTGLTNQFGETELSTQVNKLRQGTLERGEGKYFVESGFDLGANFQHGWTRIADGSLEGAWGTVGFDVGAKISSRVIVAAKDDNVRQLVAAPLSALKEMRGFVYPRSLDDLRKMKEGEMFALRGQGKLGGNFGIGAPLLVAEPTAGLAYRIMVSAGVSGVIGGQLDVQVVRMGGNEVVVDVGVQNGHGLAFHAAVSDSWGIKGLCSNIHGDGPPCLRNVELAGRSFNLSELVEKAIEKKVNEYLTFKIEGGKSSSTQRMSVSRFRFRLDKGDKQETETALENLLKFDLRLAQALAMRDLDQKTPAIEAEADVMRNATTSSRNFGIELFGMNIFSSSKSTNEGTFVVQTPSGVQSILYRRVNESGAFFQRPHDWTRTGIATQTIDARDPENFRSEANLFLQSVNGDTHLDDDLLSDNVDGMLVGIGGADIVAKLDEYGNALERRVWEKCPVQDASTGGEGGGNTTKKWDEQCNIDLLKNDPFMAKTKKDGLDAIAPLVARLPESYRKLAQTAAEFRLTIQSIGIHNIDVMNGPPVSFTLDARFDDKALSMLTAEGSRDKYRQALKSYFTATYANRISGSGGTAEEVERKWGGDMNDLARIFDQGAAAYRRVAGAEAQIPSKLRGKNFVSTPMGLRFTVQSDDKKTYESAVIGSIASERALAAENLVVSLKARAEKMDVPLFAEQTTVYPLLQMVPRENLEVGMQISVDTKSSFWMKRERFALAGLQSTTAAVAKGQNVAQISAGMFDLQKIIAPSQTPVPAQP